MDKFENILIHIRSGMSLSDACKQPNTHGRTKFYELIGNDEELANRYARAANTRAEIIFDEILSIADETEGDKVTIDKDGVAHEKVDHENIQRSRLRIEARKWVLAKMNPEKYSDKSQVDHTSNGETVNVISLGSGIRPDESTS